MKMLIVTVLGNFKLDYCWNSAKLNADLSIRLAVCLHSSAYAPQENTEK